MNFDDYITIAGGDWQQVRELKRMYNNLLEQKFAYLESLGYEYLNNYARAEADVKLAKLTGQIKAIDAKITHLLTGREIIAETEPQGLEYYYSWNIHESNLRMLYNTLKEKYEEARKTIIKKDQQLNGYRAHTYRREKELLKHN